MTRLYRLDAPAIDIATAFEASARDDPWAGGYIAPEKFAPVITAGRDFIAGPRLNRGMLAQPRITPRLWGVLPPPNAHDPTRRIHTVRHPESPFWIGNLRNSEFRCLIPATAFMLWGSGTDYEGRRLRHWFALEGVPIFAMLGVWKDEDVPAFALLTTEATGSARELGAKTTPRIIPDNRRMRDLWLHASWDRARDLLDASVQANLTRLAHPPA